MEVLMFARRILILSAVALGTTLVEPIFVAAQETPAPDVANAPYQFLGEITAANTFVRSGPREGDYATSKLDKGQQVTVVGIKFDWLKILPPEGSFSYVSKAFVQQYGDGKRGRVTKNDLSVRAGSSLNALKSQVQTKLNDGDEVEIIGEQDEYFRIKPPAGAYLYVKKDFVRPIRAINNGAAAGAETPQPETPANNTADAGTIPLEPGDPTTAAPETQQAQTALKANPVAPQAATAASEQFNKLEERYAQALALPLDQQPIEELSGEYETLSSGTELPESMRRIAAGRVAALKIRKQAKDELLAVRKEHAEMQARRLALKAEQQELEEQLKANAVEVYTAVGTLRASSLQRGEGRLYRLTDPQSGRTLVYLRTDDNSIATMIGQFVGVRGTTATEPQLNLNVITPQTVKPVDMNQIGKGVVAQILPPSVVAPGATASTGTDASE
jgi:uncharacterized protein YgiM (DUF1202 family)